MGIEVKASIKSLEYAKFYITKNEWEKTTYIHNYKFYLWNFDKLSSFLCIIDKKDITAFIPKLNKPADWATLCFDFNYFFKKFPVKNIKNCMIYCANSIIKSACPNAPLTLYGGLREKDF